MSSITHRKILVALFFYFEFTYEEVNFCKTYYGSYSTQACTFSCGGYCSDEGGTKVSCKLAQGEGIATNCCCRKYRGLERGDENCEERCEEGNFTVDLSQKRCTCECSDSLCNRLCQKNLQLGKCKPKSKQMLGKNACEPCYCSDEDCRSRYETRYSPAVCNSTNACVVTCNATESTVPPGVVIGKRGKCPGECDEAKCTKYCKSTLNRPFGICTGELKCTCQYTDLTNDGCKKYCFTRTKEPALATPDRSGGYCACHFRIGKNCQCGEKAKCSKLDGCPCSDRPDVVNAPQTKVTGLCSGKYCWVQQDKADLSKGYTVSKKLYRTNSRGLVCRAEYLYSFKNSEILGVLVPDVDGVDFSVCLLTALGDDKKPILFEREFFSLLQVQTVSDFGFVNMKKGAAVPKNAFGVEGYYLGRAFAGSVIGTINTEGIMVGGNITKYDLEGDRIWEEPIYPTEFEIFVCSSPIGKSGNKTGRP